jgi:phosphonate transport system substrate-binding protein
METTFTRQRLLQAVLLSLMLFLPLTIDAQQQHVLVMGATHSDPKQHIGTMRPMAAYMEQKLRPLGIEHVEILIVPDRNQMINLLRDNRIDWVSETAFGATELTQRAEAELFLRKSTDGVGVYRSVFFARRDSGIQDIDDLRSKIVAFEHPNSTSAFFVPATMMLAKNLPLDALVTPREKPRRGEFGYVFSGNEYNTAIWVKLGLVDAGVLSSTDWVNEDILPATFRDEMVIIAESGDYPRAVELVRSGLDPNLKDALRTSLLTMHEDPDARNVLKAYGNTARFDGLTPEDKASLLEISSRLEDFEEHFR